MTRTLTTRQERGLAIAARRALIERQSSLVYRVRSEARKAPYVVRLTPHNGWHCACPDRARRCKHVHALLAQLGDLQARTLTEWGLEAIAYALHGQPYTWTRSYIGGHGDQAILAPVSGEGRAYLVEGVGEALYLAHWGKRFGERDERETSRFLAVLWAWLGPEPTPAPPAPPLPGELDPYPYATASR